METPAGTVNIEMAVRLGSDPIAGELRAHPAPPRAFVGWVALVRSIEEALSAAQVTRSEAR